MAIPKLCPADQEHLVQLMLDAICERMTKRDINKIARAFLKSIDVELHANTIAQYYKKAEDQFSSPYAQARKNQRVNAMKRLDTLYKRCVANNDLSTALKIEKELTLLRGIYKDLDADDKEQTINIVFKDATAEDIEE